MSPSSPFAPAAHTLGAAQLRPLAGPDIGPLSRACAAIDPFCRLGYSAEGLDRYLRRADAHLHRHAIVAAGEVAGVLAVRFPWLRGPFIEMLALLPAAQGNGLGRAVVTWVTDRAEEANVWSTVSDFNSGGRRFYARLGFAEVAPLAGLLAAGGDEILLRRAAGR